MRGPLAYDLDSINDDIIDRSKLDTSQIFGWVYLIIIPLDGILILILSLLGMISLFSGIFFILGIIILLYDILIIYLAKEVMKGSMTALLINIVIIWYLYNLMLNLNFFWVT